MQKISRFLTIFIIIYSQFSVFLAYADEQKFNIEFNNNILYFHIKLQEDYKIYSKEAGSSGIPTRIKFSNSSNLQKYDIMWPTPIEDTSYGVDYIYTGDVSIPVIVSPADSSKPMRLKGEISYTLCKDMCTPVVQEFDIHNCYISNDNIWFMIAGAILGGFILNFMPCVLPVLLLKVFSLSSMRTHNFRLHLVSTILGIFSTFWALSLSTIWFKSLGMEFGIGIHFQEPRFIIILCILMTIFISNLLGRFEIRLPSIFTSNLANKKFDNPYLNSFATGVISTIFATPCTAPFIGSAIAFSMASDLQVIFLIFSSIALGFSLPYLALLIWEPLIQILPAPGRWMQTLKIFLAVAMFGTVFWLLSILQAQIGFRPVFGTVLLLLLIKFISEQNISLGPKIAAYIALFTALMYLPNMAAQEDHKKAAQNYELWHKFSVEEIGKHVNKGKIVVIDVTADWCGTCKYNKFMVWDKEKTIRLLNNPNIIAMREDITRASNETRQYMASLGIYGIPLNIVFGPNAKKGILLPTILNYAALEKALIEAGLK